MRVMEPPGSRYFLLQLKVKRELDSPSISERISSRAVVGAWLPDWHLITLGLCSAASAVPIFTRFYLSQRSMTRASSAPY